MNTSLSEISLQYETGPVDGFAPPPAGRCVRRRGAPSRTTRFILRVIFQRVALFVRHV